MRLLINGEAHDWSATTEPPTVADLLVRQNLAGKAVAVEVNRQLVPRKLHATTRLQDGDRVELVTLVGGG